MEWTSYICFQIKPISRRTQQLNIYSIFQNSRKDTYFENGRSAYNKLNETKLIKLVKVFSSKKWNNNETVFPIRINRPSDFNYIENSVGPEIRIYKIEKEKG